ncbi:MAG: hypothetical protein IPM60_01425 [Rhodospirillales bacterium]|nr:hypothetical protein [Rhodospirillales bacterium]
MKSPGSAAVGHWFAVALREVERVSAILYLGFGLYVAVDLIGRAFRDTLWLLLPAAMVIVSASVVVPTLIRHPDRGVRLGWPFRRRRA